MSNEFEQGSTGDRYVATMTTICEQYLETVRELERNRKPAEGLLGMKGGPADNPCHDRFAEDMKALLCEFESANPPSVDVRLVLEKLYAVPERAVVPKSAYWMLIAVQGLCQELISRLDPQDASAIAKRYAADYRRWERMPVQQKILAALQKQSK